MLLWRTNWVFPIKSRHATTVSRMSCIALTVRVCLQDLPEYFEDNMASWMDNFHPLLATDNKLLETEVSALSFSLTYSQYVTT